ncbi:hypothetical protein RhiirC2_801801 [Rhizophagus irregularis]|uniref:Highly derived d5-like helicase-primase: PROVISIONAL n=1 Tax=Rhizophagus irregularis TaxID=588596 RepID=A0A2N1M1Y5_9GLOM|nr:hypothetical protein RhiirC2_801801 [Rhizophagus irregularis]
MCNIKEKFTRKAVYEAVQVTIACIQIDTKLWVLKLEDSNGGLFFKMSSKLDLRKYEISLVEMGGDVVKLENLIDQAVVKGIIQYRGIDFLSFPPCSPPPNTKFFNLFLGFKAPIIEIDSALIELIIWHIKNVWCDENKDLSKYVLNWFAYLVQYPDKKPGTVLVLRSPPRSGKNILTDFIGKEVLGQNYSLQHLILGKY